MYRIGLGLLACLGIALLFAAPVPVPVAGIVSNVAHRATTSLDGSWRIIIDPYESGVDQRFYENRKPKSPSDRVEYDFDTSEPLKVPGDWNTQAEKLLLYEGLVWYEHPFTHANRPGRRTFLYFGAANSHAWVYLNGVKLGEHAGGFTPFAFEVTNTLRDGNNFVVVAVSNGRRADGVPALVTDFWNYGGLTRHVMLVETPGVFIRDYLVQLAPGSRKQLAGWVQLDGVTKPESVTLRIPEAGIEQRMTTDAAGRAEFQFPAELDLWSPAHPKLYKVSLSAADDTVDDEIGFRTIEARGAKILLNGAPIFLRGISMHEEAPLRGGRAFSAEDDRILLQWAKDLGCNFVRLAHYPYNEDMVRLADRMGLLVWEEIPVYWQLDWQNPATFQNADQQLRELVARDRNRASVIFWSVGNETPASPPRTEFLKRLASTARQLDASRLITAAFTAPRAQQPFVRTFTDPAGDALDVIGVNEYVGWYDGAPEDAERTHWSSAYAKPMILSEFGAGAPYGRHGSDSAVWTEEYQARVYEHQIRMIEQMPDLAGMSPWVLMDFRSPRRWLPGIQDFYNRKGLISGAGERKKAFFVLQDFYRARAAREK